MQAIAVGSYVFQSEVATRLGLNPTDLHAIHLLGMAPDGLMAGRLGDLLGLSSGATSIAIDRLVEAGFVERTPDPTDRRRRIVRMLPTGKERLRAQYTSVDERVAEAIASIDADQRDAVAGFLARIADDHVGLGR